MYCPWSVNEIIHRGHYAECCKEFLLVQPLRGANERKWNDEMMNDDCTDGDGKWREVLRDDGQGSQESVSCRFE